MNLNEIKPSGPVEIRQSSIKVAYACKRKWLLKYRLGIALRGVQLKLAANLGQIYHKFQQFGPERIDDVKSWVQERQRGLMQLVDTGEDIDGSAMRLANSMAELYHKAEVMARLFWERYPLPEYLELVASEVDAYVRLNGRNGLLLAGRIDRILQNKQDGSYWIRDHKSTGRTLDTIFGGLAWSIQARLYRILANQWLRDNRITTAHVRGFIMDGIVMPGIKLCKKDEKAATELGTTPEEAYLIRVRAWYSEQANLGKDVMLSKALVFAEPIWNTEVLSFVRDMSNLTFDSYETQEQMDSHFPRDVTRQACYQHGTKCEYHDLCETSIENWDDLFECKYKFMERQNEDEEENLESEND